MSDEAPTPSDEPKKAKKATPAVVRGVILRDDCFSSVGRHKLGEKVELSEDDAAALEKNNFFVRVDPWK